MSQDPAELLPINNSIFVTVESEKSKIKMISTMTNTKAYLWKAALKFLICMEESVIPSILTCGVGLSVGWPRLVLQVLIRREGGMLWKVVWGAHLCKICT